VWERAFDKELQIVGALHKAGVIIVAGSDARIPGHEFHRELELLVKAGLTPMEAIQSATIVPARVMKLDKELGTIQPGKRADLIIVDGNPLENISLIRNVKTIIKDGRIYESATLWESIGFTR
jgi:imidazolonepropionase-like amidohydrolase